MGKTQICLVVITLLLGGPMDAKEEKEGKGGESFIKIKAKGTLRTGLVAIGGETTGTTLTTKDGTLELDFGSNKKLRDLAAKLDKKRVKVTGTLALRKGVENPKTRLIVRVSQLKAAEDKEK
jgi:hypothetical protein